MVLLLLSSAYTEPRLFLLPTLPVIKAGGTQGVGRGHSQDSCLLPTQGIFHTAVKTGERRRQVGTVRVVAFVFASPKHDRGLLSWGWLNTCMPWEWMNEFLVLLRLHAQLLLSLLTCLYLNPRVFSLLLL